MRPKRKSRRAPGRAARRARAPRLPKAAEALYLLAARKVAAEFAKAARRLITPWVASLPRPTIDRLDAAGKKSLLASAQRVAQAVRSAVRKAVRKVSSWVDSVRDKVGKRTADHAVRELDRLGVRPKKDDPQPDHSKKVDSWKGKSAERAEKAVEDQIDKVAKAMTVAVEEEMDPDEARDTIDDIVGKQTERRLEGAASDDVLTLNVEIQVAQAKASRSPGYIWTSQGDDFVRKLHRELDGQEFTWEEGHPEEGHPGEPHNCRCIAFPFVDPDDEHPEA